MKNLAKNIISIDIEEELKHSYLDYAMSVIVGRALPDVRDGLKPVHRRILFAMHILGNYWNKTYKKSARIVGDVIGKYHPHGDSAVYDAIVRMAQSFSLRYMLIDGQGNFGSIDGDAAAAMRYTEIRMSRIAHELILDLEKETVNYSLNYDSTESIPEVMPTRIPNLLINGASGIAVGMATNIPPHNLSEVINACLAFINNKEISIDELMKHLPGPDFPTAGIINNHPGIKEAYSTGRGKIYIRARTKIEVDPKNGRENIIIYEIPYQVNKTNLIEKIAELIREKRIEGISNLRDESDQDGMRIVIEIKRDALSKVVQNNLYSFTQLQTSFSINMVALHQGRPRIMSLKDILSAFISHRREIVTRRTIFELKKIGNRIYIVEALLVALANIDEMIKLIRISSSNIEATTNLVSQSWKLNNKLFIILNKSSYNNVLNIENVNIKNRIFNKQYYLTTLQAKAILDLRLQKLTSLASENVLDEYKELIHQTSKLTLILNNPEHLIQVIREELLQIKNQYKDPRLTEINNSNININVEDLINQKDVIVTLSHNGYVKCQPIKDYEAQHRGGKGKLATNIKEEDFIECLLVANTHDTILLFSSHGRVYWMKVHQLPEASRISRGRPIINLLPLEIDENVTAILPLREYEKGYHVFMATSHGIVKKTNLTEFSRPRTNGIIAINLNKNDKLIGVDLTNGNNEVMLFSAYGKVVRFPEKQVRSMRRSSIGVKGMNLVSGDKVVSLIIPRGNGSILTVTKYGYGKQTSQTEYPTKSRAIKGVISIKVNIRNGEVVGAVQVEHCDQIMIITDAGTLVRIKISEVSKIGRNTHGITLIRTTKYEHVVGLQRIIDS